ncbi:MAG: aminotransferase class V-fold PLP-dependent enzyme [Bacteroidales bacterium]|nr:aminotransferase class V-fold PLP-dependent enzyme [Bacteroidales bacterium]MBN2758373.1 aminotransferase class V-fold PLP-dependent enzyme [Bacteroidales bacterium]
MESLEKYFEQFRKNIVGIDSTFESPYGTKKIIYADWIASGRLYAPIEDKIKEVFGPFVGNTHSEASETGVAMTLAYHLAHKIIKDHVNANEKDILITAGAGMTGVVNKFQRILGLRVPEQAQELCKMSKLPDNERPVVFITHMEHHSNQTSWLETIADVVVLEPSLSMRVIPDNLEAELQKYKDRKIKIGSFSACSNVTGLMPPIYKLARIMHENGGYCFIDFAASAPYVDINMHPEDSMEQLDAIFFSPHKALGGPGSAGVLVFNSSLYKNKAPDNPGGGTVAWTNRWNEFEYVSDIEAKEDGGTPAFIQTFRVALTLKLKEKMGVKNIHNREKEILDIIFPEFDKIDKLHILSSENRDRLGVISFYIEGVHHNLIVKLMNDKFGVQFRGGCSCAGTYGHFLLNVDKEKSNEITKKINSGDLTEKPGWVRMSIHPTMSNNEVYYIIDALKQLVENIEEWQKDYYFDKIVGEYFNRNIEKKTMSDFNSWFEI